VIVYKIQHAKIEYTDGWLAVLPPLCGCGTRLGSIRGLRAEPDRIGLAPKKPCSSRQTVAVRHSLF
jgi:hypothetical protein